jgi:hypothetical protein
MQRLQRHQLLSIINLVYTLLMRVNYDTRFHERSLRPLWSLDVLNAACFQSTATQLALADGC